LLSLFLCLLSQTEPPYCYYYYRYALFGLSENLGEVALLEEKEKEEEGGAEYGQVGDDASSVSSYSDDEEKKEEGKDDVKGLGSSGRTVVATTTPPQSLLGQRGAAPGLLLLAVALNGLGKPFAHWQVRTISSSSLFALN